MVLELCRGLFHNPENREFKHRNSHTKHLTASWGGICNNIRITGKFSATDSGVLDHSVLIRNSFTQWSQLQSHTPQSD